MIQFLEICGLRVSIDRRRINAVLDSMSNGKDQAYDPLGRGSPRNGDGSTADTSRSGTAPSEEQGWEAYRKWLSRVSMQPTRRSARDVSIYSWRGYNNWADKVRQNWKSEDS